MKIFTIGDFWNFLSHLDYAIDSDFRYPIDHDHSWNFHYHFDCIDWLVPGHNIVETMSDIESFAEKHVVEDLDRRFVEVAVLPRNYMTTVKDNNMQLKFYNLYIKIYWLIKNKVLTCNVSMIQLRLNLYVCKIIK